MQRKQNISCTNCYNIKVGPGRLRSATTVGNRRRKNAQIDKKPQIDRRFQSTGRNQT